MFSDKSVPRFINAVVPGVLGSAGCGRIRLPYAARLYDAVRFDVAGGTPTPRHPAKREQVYTRGLVADRHPFGG